MSCPFLPEHQAEAAAAAAPAAAAGGRHDETEDGPDERQDEPWRHGGGHERALGGQGRARGRPPAPPHPTPGLHAQPRQRRGQAWLQCSS